MPLLCLKLLRVEKTAPYDTDDRRSGAPAAPGPPLRVTVCKDCVLLTQASSSCVQHAFLCRAWSIRSSSFAAVPFRSPPHLLCSPPCIFAAVPLGRHYALSTPCALSPPCSFDAVCSFAAVLFRCCGLSPPCLFAATPSRVCRCAQALRRARAAWRFGSGRSLSGACTSDDEPRRSRGPQKGRCYHLV